MYEPDAIDGNEDGKQRRQTYDVVGIYLKLFRCPLLETVAILAAAGRCRLFLVLVVPLVAWKDDVAYLRNA